MSFTNTEQDTRYRRQLRHRRTARTAMLSALACVLATAIPPALAKAPQENLRSASRVSVPTVSMTRLRSDACLRIDKQTGQWVPCTSPGGRSGTGRTQRDPAPAPQPLAFDAFDYSYDDADFDNDEESVIPNAYLLSQLAGAAYRPTENDAREPHEIATELGLSALSSLGTNGEISRDTSAWHELGEPDAESKAFVFINQHAVFVTFEGSTGGPTGTDWLENNIDIGPHDMPEWGHKTRTLCGFLGCYSFTYDHVTLHQGFHDAMAVIYEDVRDAVEPLVAGGRELWITGHSLGGAAALLTAFRLQFEDDVPVQGVHVFGAPAVGDWNWMRAFEAELGNVHRWHDQLDPIPVLLQAPAYYHVGRTHNLYVDGSFLLDATGSEMFGYPLACNTLYRYNIAHMRYWSRMHELLEDTHPSVAAQFPAPLSVPTGNCLHPF